MTVVSGIRFLPREAPGAHVIARGDREEALSRPDDVPDDRRRRAARKRAVRPGTGDPVGIETASKLVAAERDARPACEPPVDGAPSEAVAPQPELEHCDVPSHGSDPELALAEQRSPAAAQRSPRGATHLARRPDPVLPLERDDGRARHRPAHPVDRTRIEPVGTEPDLESGDASTGRHPAGSEREDANGHRDADDGEATHATGFAVGRPHPPGRAAWRARLQSGRCLPR